MSGARLILATRNRGKAAELSALLGGALVETLDAFPELVMPEESGSTFEENAIAKAEFVCGVVRLPALADDSGLAVDALHGAPGVRSARYAEGTDADRWAKLLKELSGVAGARRGARFVCAMAFARPGEPTLTAFGELEGQIGFEPRGEGGFGYDPVFVLPDGRHLAEIGQAEKNQISHRGKALRSLLPALRGHLFP